MAEGVRIRHTVVKNATVVVRDVSRPAPNPKNRPWPGCAKCNLASPGHGGFKTVHIDVDTAGFAIVSPTIWENLKRFVDLGGFELSNPVPAPPRVEINFRAGGVTTRTLHKIQPNISTEILKGQGNGNSRS